MRLRHQVDGEIGRTLVEVKSGLDAVRNLHVGILQLALALEDSPQAQRGLLVVAAPTMSRARLQEEWQSAVRAIRRDLAGRLQLVLWDGDRFEGLPNDHDAAFRGALDRVVRRELERTPVRARRGEAFYDVLKLLVHAWMTSSGAMTSAALAKAAGCSYPTVADAVRRLGAAIARRSYRSVELAYFPRDEWSALVAVSERVRSTIRFSDRSGQPRSFESLLRRFRSLGRSDVGVGGVSGAKHYVPGLDIVGLPRLDLVVHGRGARTGASFVEKLDPALRRAEGRDEPIALAVHFLRRPEPLFVRGTDKLLWADPVECLLDLHDARLEPQALEFLQHFEERKGRAQA
ncbi:MAG: hypothetical protein JXB32_21935 [Deltaproteobacteria bacterium]|nr:hypothetical protein [Deltaproteobacteria bacterium]